MEYEQNECLYRDDGTFWFDYVSFYRPVWFSGNLNPYYQFGKKQKVVKNNTDFLENLHSRVYRKSKKQITRIVSIERGLKNKKLHTHMIIETPDHLSTDTFLRFLKQSWLGSKGGTDFYIKSKEQVYDEIGLEEYIGKQQNLEEDTLLSEEGIDEMNCYTNESVNITS